MTRENIGEISKNLNLNNIYLYGFVSPKETIKYRNSFDIVLAPYTKLICYDSGSKTIGYQSIYVSNKNF